MPGLADALHLGSTLARDDGHIPSQDGARAKWAPTLCRFKQSV